MGSLIFENSTMRLAVGENAVVESLIYKKTGEELLAPGVELSLFTVTQERPYNNENKLIYMNQRTTYTANALTREGDILTVGFDVAPYRALVEVKVTDDYVNFALIGFDVQQKDFGGLAMDKPPATEFCLCRLAVRERENYGRWLNVMWDSDVAVNLLASCPRAIIDADAGKDYRVMHATAMRGLPLIGTSAALIVAPTSELLDRIDRLERDFDLPLGVASRRDPATSGSMYWTGYCTPETVDEHIALCKAGGFPMMTLYYPCFYKSKGYRFLGDYDLKDCYPNGIADVRAMLDKIRAAGIIPGLHVLPTHIGLDSRYVTPVCDHRLRLKQDFTLSRPLGLDDDVVYVEECPIEAPQNQHVRVLRFGGELISYEDFSVEPPYCFRGCKRGDFATNVTAHPLGERGGVMDISEYGAQSTYLDQRTSLQDEVNEKILALYNGAGFRYMYFDGAEGTNEPFGYYVSLAQYKMYKGMTEAPLFCTGAAKTHFGWHMLGGSNAFDIFKTDVFKEKIDEFPVKAADVLAKDFTVVNFGWWAVFADTRPDVYEYGISRAIAWNCPVTLQSSGLSGMEKNPRYRDALEALRLWNAARDAGYITDEMKRHIREDGREYIMLCEDGRYAMYPTEAVALANAPGVYAYAFAREEGSAVSLIRMDKDATLSLKAPDFALSYVRMPGDAPLPLSVRDGRVLIPVGDRRILLADAPYEALVSWIAEAVIEE